MIASWFGAMLLYWIAPPELEDVAPVIVFGAILLTLGAAAYTGTRARSAFPSDLTIDQKMAIWRIVRDGGPVDDLRKARAVLHHANWVLTGPKPDILAIVVGSVLSIVVVSAIAHVATDQPQGAMWFLIIAAVIAATIPPIAHERRYRKTAENVRLQALQLLGLRHN